MKKKSSSEWKHFIEWLQVMTEYADEIVRDIQAENIQTKNEKEKFKDE